MTTTATLADVAIADRLYYASACNLTNDDVAGMTEEELDSCLGLDNAWLVAECRNLAPGQSASMPWHAGGEIIITLATLGEMLRRIAFRARESATYAYKESREAWAAGLRGEKQAELSAIAQQAFTTASKAEAAADVAELAESAPRQAALAQVKITARSLATLLDYAADAGNWSGTPLVGGNVGGSKEDRGNLTQLKRAGLITTSKSSAADGGDTWIHFTKLGEDLALSHGIKV